MPEPIRKTYELKADATTLKDNTLKGGANVMGVLDQGTDVAFPGFFEPSLPDFRKSGFVARSHKWDELPIAMPTKAVEVGNQLYTEAEWHTHQAAQDARSVCMERLGKGLSMGLSVGFMPDYETAVKHFPNGKSLISYAKANGADITLFDVAGINAFAGMCRGLLPGGCLKLWEYSVTPAPMNVDSLISDAKSVAMAQLLTLKGQYLPGMERSAVCSAVSAIMSKLSSAIWSALYNVTAESVSALTSGLTPAFDEARDYVAETISALLDDADLDELREDSSGAYYYYSALAEQASAKQIAGSAANVLNVQTTTVREFEAFLRDAGYSRKDAAAIALHGFSKGRGQRDAGNGSTTEEDRKTLLRSELIRQQIDRARTLGVPVPV